MDPRCQLRYNDQESSVATPLLPYTPPNPLAARTAVVPWWPPTVGRPPVHASFSRPHTPRLLSTWSFLLTHTNTSYTYNCGEPPSPCDTKRSPYLSGIVQTTTRNRRIPPLAPNLPHTLLPYHNNTIVSEYRLNTTNTLPLLGH